jgi:serine/threonine protein kinase
VTELVPGYRDLKRVAQGSSGTVYRAQQVKPARVVALKVLSVPVDERSLARFHRECEFAVGLGEHPHIVTVLDHGMTADGQPYLAMHYFPDGSLADRSRIDGPLPVPDVLRYGIQIAGALAFVHEMGAVHRDVKPGNVLVSRHGPVLGDFGVAVLGDELSTGNRTQAFTPEYTAPEVLDSPAAAGPASDVYALGGTLYHLLTRRPPFRQGPQEGIVPFLRRIATEPPEDVGRADVPPDLVAVLGTAMAKYPAARYGTAVAFAHALQQVQRAHGDHVTELPYAAPRPRPVVPDEVDDVEAEEVRDEVPEVNPTVLRGDRVLPVVAEPRPAPDRSARRYRWAAVVAILGLALLISSLFPTYTVSTLSGWSYDLASASFVLWYTIVVAVLVAAAATGLFVQGIRRVAAGVLLGVAAATTWALVNVASGWIAIRDERAGPGLPLNLAAHVVLVLAGVLAARGLRAEGGIRFAVRRLPGPTPWLVIIAGVVGALALVYLSQHRNRFGYPAWTRLPDIWAAVLAFTLPPLSLLLHPRWFGAALLGGWVGGGTALFLRFQLNPDTPHPSAIVFGGTLLGLAALLTQVVRDERRRAGRSAHI